MSRRMSPRRLLAVAIIGGFTASVLFASPALAGGDAGDVTQTDGSPGSGGSGPPAPTPPPPRLDSGQGGAATGGRSASGTAAPVDTGPPPGVAQTAGTAAACGANGGCQGAPPVATPAGAPTGPALPAGPPPEEVAAAQARVKLHVTIPEPRFSADRQIVTVPTWMWFPAGEWKPLTASAGQGLLVVTITATPVSSRWDMGDGQVVTCTGPGTALDHWPAGVDPRTVHSPDCDHVYTRWSGDQPGGEWPVTVHVRYRITWFSTTGRSGVQADLVLERNDIRIPVDEVQALNGR